MTPPAPSAHVQRIGGFRWWIVALLFFATTINYIDRQVIGVLKENISTALKWTPDNKEIYYGYVVMAFQAMYAGGYLLAGRLTDIIGIKRGLGLAVGLWSLMAVATGWAGSVVSMCLVRGGLGLAEGGNFPSAIKAVGEWFPAKERALATGIFNAGSNFGPVLTPLIVPVLALHFGWQSAFYVTGALGFLWLLWWAAQYRAPRSHPSLSEAELAYIKSDPPDPQVDISWGRLLSYRAVWGYILGTLLTSPIWWFYLFWSPDFFTKQFGLDLKNIGLPLIMVYVLADIGSVGGGWLSSFLIHRGSSVTVARKVAMLASVLGVAPIFLAPSTHSEWVAVALFGLAAAAHQGWSANLFTLASDTMPKKMVSSVVGIGGMAGGVASIFFSLFVARTLQSVHNYTLVLLIPPGAYLLAFLSIHLLIPRVEPMVRDAV